MKPSAATLVLLVATSGCSLTRVRGPASASRADGCTTDQTVPAVDTVAAVATAVAGIVIVAMNPPPSCASSDAGCFLDLSPIARGVGYGFMGVSALSAVSATWGFATVTSCRAAMNGGTAPPPLVLRPDPVCVSQRAERLRRAQEIVDVKQRSEALRSIPECKATPVAASPPL